MSAQRMSNQRKSYCKVCHDAGKSEEMYTSHYVRSEPGPNGKVVCPTLLAIECKYCFKQGHTASHCQEIAKNNKMAAKTEAKKNYRENKEEVKKLNKKNKNNLFDLLNEEDEVVKEKKDKKIVKDEFPALTSKKLVPTTTPVVVSYASIAQKGYQEAVKAEILQERKSVEIEKPIIVKKIIPEQKKRSWAEMASDDEDEEEEEVNLPNYSEYMNQYLANDAW
jgi:hypothetical protein